MPLLDHFHPPLYPGRHWESFHAKWANCISDELNDRLLPEGYVSEIQVHVGSRVEVDVATFEAARLRSQHIPAEDAGTGGTAVAEAPAETYAPPAPTLTIPAFFPDSVEVLVYNMASGYTLVAAVELLSPGNKDREEARRSFAAKCLAYLREGVGLITLDIVTSRGGNTFDDLMALMSATGSELLEKPELSAVSFHPVRRASGSRDVPTEEIRIWPHTLSLGRPLPVLPLFLDRGLCVPLDLEASYTDALRRSRIR